MGKVKHPHVGDVVKVEFQGEAIWCIIGVYINQYKEREYVLQLMNYNGEEEQSLILHDGIDDDSYYTNENMKEEIQLTPDEKNKCWANERDIVRCDDET